MKIGCCIRAEEIDRAAQCGFDFVDLHGAELAQMAKAKVRTLADKLDQLGLPCLGIHASVPSTVRLNGPDYDEEKVRLYFQSLKDPLDMLHVQAVGLGSPMSRSLPEGYAREKANEQMIRSMIIASEELPNQQILLESLNTMETNYINSLAEAYELVSRANHPRVGLVLDLYHFVLCGDNLSMLTDDCIRKIGYLHIADPVERKYPSDQTDESLEKLLKNAVSLVSCDAIALEAISVPGSPDLLDGWAYLHTKIK